MDISIYANKTQPTEVDEPSMPDEPQWADEMEQWLPDLEYDEPELHEALIMLGEAVEAEDMEAIVEAWDVVDAAMLASNPEYPALSDDERAFASERIAHHHRHLAKHPGDRGQAIAIGLREAAPEKYAAFQKQRES